MLTEVLQQYNFSEREAKVYLAALSLGSAPGSTIARYAWEKRVTTYAILKELIKKGIFTSVMRDDITYFSPISPELLVNIYEDKYRTLKEKLPELMAITGTIGKKPKMRYFEGVDGIKTLYNSILEKSDPLFAFLSDGEINPKLQDYLNKEFVEKRRVKNIKASVIVSGKEKNEEYLKITKKDKLTATKIVEENVLALEGEVILYWENCIACALYSNEEMIGYSIQSDQLYKSLKSMFDFIWKRI